MIGVLALQGDYSKHIQILEMLDFKVLEVRYPRELSLIEGLVIPGGESTTISDLMERANFHDPIKNFAALDFSVSTISLPTFVEITNSSLF